MLVWLAFAALAAPPAEDPAAEEAGAARRALLKTFREEFVLLTPGRGDFPAEFVRGSDDGPENERPAKSVRFGYEFFIAKYEVPQNLYEAVVGENPSRWKGPRNSVERVSFAEAEEFCRRATKLLREAGLIAADQLVRLPSEAEWEYAARAGTTARYSFGDDPDALGAYGWFAGNAAGNDPPVGAKRPNPWGLYDVHGYLREWTLDAPGPYAEAPTDGSPRVVADAAERIVRGGSWKDGAAELTSSFRLPTPGDTRDDAVGLRCVLVRGPEGR